MGTLTARLMQEVPDLILITCSRSETLESVTNTVQTIRKVASGGPVIAVGGAMNTDREIVLQMTGADIVTNLAGEAVALCAERARPCGRK
jgi:methanogenic corrinoid protein MtbC1